MMIGHAMLLRGDNVRRLDFADLWLVPLEESEEFDVNCLVFNLMGTKTTNKAFGVAMRNKSVNTCIFGALACYFFDLFNSESLLC